MQTDIKHMAGFCGKINTITENITNNLMYVDLITQV